MTKVSRNDIYVRDENGPDWFTEFLRTYDINKSAYPTSIQDIMGIITNRRGETVESIVKKYREQVGLDMVQSSDEDDQQVKNASYTTRPLSIRQAAEESTVDKIKSDKGLQDALESLCKHSGGHKSIQALISFLRDELGPDVSYSDEALKKYLTECKDKFMSQECEDKDDRSHVGLVGLDNANDIYEDDTADYILNDGNKK